MRVLAGRLLDRLDSSDAFVRPARAFLVAATRHAGERRAMRAVERAITSIRAERLQRGSPAGVLDDVYAAYADLPEAERHVRAARDVMMLHLGSQSNLHAALAWTLVNVLQRPALVARIRDGDDAVLEQCASESIRLAQRSITLRLVLRPLDLELEDGTYRIAPGVLLTTMLSVTNTSAAPGFDRFDPAHYDGRRLAPQVAVPARELVSTFGHGSHSCPAQRFAVTAIRVAVRRLTAADRVLRPHPALLDGRTPATAARGGGAGTRPLRGGVPGTVTRAPVRRGLSRSSHPGITRGGVTVADGMVRARAEL